VNTTLPETTRDWVPIPGAQGLYLRSLTGIYYARYLLKGKRRWHSLETKTITEARVKHAEVMLSVARQRKSAGPAPATSLRTLGGCAQEFTRLVEQSTRTPGSKAGYAWRVTRLRGAWPGDFDSALARTVGHDAIFDLRERLRADYKPEVVNQTLWVLKKLLDLAVESGELGVNPFGTIETLRGELWLEVRRSKRMPSRSEVESVFREMRTVPEGCDTALRDFYQRNADARADHAEFLALTGMRLQEANRALIEDDHGDWLHVRGTKTATSTRRIPVHPALRVLVDRLKGDRTSGRLLQVKSCRSGLKKACLRLGIPPLTHHHFRHYYATVCIESGVDIPTVSRFLGHADGGILAMKTYGHLRDEHAKAMGQRIRF
jgi:integrase